MSLSYIRKYYKVPAYRGAPVCYHAPDSAPKYGKITSSYVSYIKIKFDNETKTHNCPFHPTWCITYLNQQNNASNP